SDSTSVCQPPTRPDRSCITSTTRLLDLVALPEDEFDSDFDFEMEWIPLVKQALQPPPAPGRRVRMGVDLCGVLLVNWPARLLQNIHRPQDVAQGLVAGAMEWFEECVATCGAWHV
ncbi:MAG: hypothetical protein ACKPKO_33665, partial [Candidatus Fonsibacter sp.]